MCQTWPMSTNIARVFSWSAARERDEMLELYDRKLSRTVLRRESGSNPADLAGTIAGGFSPAGDTAEQVSRQLGEQTVMTGSVSRGKSDPSRSLQMMGRRLWRSRQKYDVRLTNVVRQVDFEYGIGKSTFRRRRIILRAGRCSFLILRRWFVTRDSPHR